jgi:PAS domain-containing protein
MRVDSYIAETFLRAAVTVVRQGGGDLHQALDTLPVPIYVTNADGVITYYNRACVAFAGRTPCVGQDRWCVTWKLYTEAGECLPRDRCPMAIALSERRRVRNIQAIAERPDGTRIKFQPYPTPLFNEDGEIIGGVNLFIDLGELQPAQTIEQAH